MWIKKVENKFGGERIQEEKNRWQDRGSHSSRGWTENVSEHYKKREMESKVIGLKTALLHGKTIQRTIIVKFLWEVKTLISCGC